MDPAGTGAVSDGTLFNGIEFSDTNLTQLVILIVLILCSAFFSASETAFSTVNRVRLKTLADEGSAKAKLVLKLLSKYSRLLSTILVGNNIVNISASALATVLATDVFGSWAVGIITGVLTVVVLLFGEIVPKTTAMLKNEKLTYSFAPVINLLMIILFPIVFVIDKLSNGILRLLKIDPNKKIVSISESEILSYVDTSHKQGVIESEEREMIHNMFDFSDAKAKDIMVPRVNMVMADIHTSLEELMELFKEHLYTRIPIYEDNPDNIVGMVNLKDVLFLDEAKKFRIKSIMREVYYTYEYKKISELMSEMRGRNASVTIVLNEYGAAEGMITLEDMIEEIFGEIRDEYDQDEDEKIQSLGERMYRIEGTMKLDDINDVLGTELESDDYDSISGIIIEKLNDRLPEEGEEVALEDGTVLKVEKAENNRILSVIARLPEKMPGKDGDNEENEDRDEGENETADFFKAE
ncbi:MAG: hemolysin family protein [Lachnospiraceae bacterium]|nr:hemolysin family protein [Lachnospiraceae bacterium]